jgi:membrane-associated PAP2 superfamily phosphatase
VTPDFKLPLERQAGLLATALLLPLAMLGLWELAALDLPAMRLIADANGFPMRDHWLTRSFFHDGGRALAGLVLMRLVWAVWRPGMVGPTRRERLWALAAVLLCLMVIPAFKRWSVTSCPWSLAEFGGTAAYVSHWLPGVADGGPGHCFPSGHAAAAFAFFPQVLLWRRHDRQRALFWLGSILALGIAFAAAQTVRGAHYPSHSLWSACLCWWLSVVLYQVSRLRSGHELGVLGASARVVQTQQ